MQTGKSEFTEVEAAEELGVSLDQFRAMVRAHILDNADDDKNLPTTTFQLSDLLILRLLESRKTGSPLTPRAS